jgi:large subunit ribosomal protein L32e
MADTKLLELRTRLKKKKPRFATQDAHKHKRVKTNWRRPRGLHSKMRLAKRGHRKKVNIGYGSPSLVKGFLKNGLLPVNISNSAGLAELDKVKHSVVLGRKVGVKKKVMIAKECKKLGLNICNIPDIDAYLKSIEAMIAEKKEAKLARIKAKEQKKKKESVKKKKEKPAEKATSAEEKMPEEKEQAEKKEQDKILVTKG